MDARAVSTIRLCLVDEVLFNIVGESTTAGLWKKLETLYMIKYLTNKIYLKRQLQLSDMEVKMEEEDKVITFLCSIPE